MDETLRSIFYSDKNKGLIGFKELYKQAKPALQSLTLKQTKAFLDSQENRQIFKTPAKDLFNPIIAPDHHFQCDLLFLRQGGRSNPVFVMVEITTRMAYLRAMKDKTALSCSVALRSILEIEKPIIKLIEHDDGGEFQGEFDQLCRQHNITNVSLPSQENSKTSLGKVERLNLTIRQFWNRSFNGRETVATAIPKIQEFYNQREHSTTHQVPENTTTQIQKARARIIDNLRGSKARTKIKKTFAEGTEVRLRADTDIFKKRSEPKWSRDTTTIEEADGVNFRVHGEDRVYRAWEMLPAAGTQKAPEPFLPPEPKQKPRALQRLDEEIEPENILEAPRTREKPKQPAPKPPKPAPKPIVDKTLKAVVFPIREYIWIPALPRKKETLQIKVKWSHLNEEENKQYELQDPSIFFLGTKKNPQLNKFFANDLKRNKLFSRFERAYGVMELSD
jgi:hypothetical protein